MPVSQGAAAMSEANETAPSTAQRKRRLRLKAHERAALTAFVRELRARYGDDLQRVVLFGSKARGDFHAESDLDILVVVRVAHREYRRCWNEIVDLAWRIELAHGVVMSLVIKDVADYNTMCAHQLLLARNIERDGVELWMMPPSAPTSSFVSPRPEMTS
jgi:predicted nucleotidyltransferase